MDNVLHMFETMGLRTNLGLQDIDPHMYSLMDLHMYLDTQDIRQHIILKKHPHKNR